MTHAIKPANLHEVRWQTALFLRHNAAPEWQLYLDRGIEYLLPDEVIDKSNRERAAFLARAEYERVASAELYYIGDEVTDVVTGSGPLAGGFHALTPDMVPSPTGLMLWSRDVSASTSGVPVIACSWERQETGVWTAWWTDAVATAESFVNSGQFTQETARNYLGLRGVLNYERERILPYGFGIRVGDAKEGPAATTTVEALTETTITTWALIASPNQRVTVTDIPPERHVKKRLQREGLAFGPVHHVTGFPPEPKPPTTG
ncbi:hypothetical protein [Streptosporangium sp. NPDC002524]|uniref:hypothetical protein n=1 Tax=Streptosporangium sp. NPDC002524 TaxID=3154537 RepID=UPI0033343BAF